MKWYDLPMKLLETRVKVDCLNITSRDFKISSPVVQSWDLAVMGSEVLCSSTTEPALLYPPERGYWTLSFFFNTTMLCDSNFKSKLPTSSLRVTRCTWLERAIGYVHQSSLGDYFSKVTFRKTCTKKKISRNLWFRKYKTHDIKIRSSHGDPPRASNPGR